MSSPLCQGDFTLEAVEVQRWLPEKNREEKDPPLQPLGNQPSASQEENFIQALGLDKQCFIFSAGLLIATLVECLQTDDTSMDMSYLATLKNAVFPYLTTCI